jgi:hypothetical protein
MSAQLALHFGTEEQDNSPGERDPPQCLEEMATEGCGLRPVLSTFPHAE